MQGLVKFRSGSRFLFATYLVVFAASVTAVLLVHSDARMGLLPAAFVFGWAQTGGF